MTTIQGLLSDAQQALAEISDTPKLDGQILLSHVLNQPVTYLITWHDKALSDNQVQQFKRLLARRKSGEPVAYIIGERDFWSLTLHVAPSTLIPRPDTETLVELVLENHQQNNLTLLDLGTGTGAIALALASEHANWQIDAVDFSFDAVELARKNAARHQLSQVSIYQSDWFSAIDVNKRFDVIVSNPPYIDKVDEHLAQGDVRFEPLSALVADKQGLADIAHICCHAPRFLKPGGSLYLEHGYQQGQQVREILLQFGFCAPNTEQDLAGNDRITWAKLT